MAMLATTKERSEDGGRDERDGPVVPTTYQELVLHSLGHRYRERVKQEAEEQAAEKKNTTNAPGGKKDIFRPYCLKDPERKTVFPPYLIKPGPFYRLCAPEYGIYPGYVSLPNLPSLPSLPAHSHSDLSTAEAILDLSSQRRNQMQVKQEQEPVEDEGRQLHNLPPYPSSHSQTHSADPADFGGAIFKINGGKTTAYTYEAFFASDGRSKNKPFGLELCKPKYRCGECGKNYATSSNLSRHKQTHRTLDSNNAKKCTVCGKMYVSMPALSMHVLTHNLSHKCRVCGKAFSRPWLLQGHLRSHTGDKPFGCAHCGKSFADRSNLRAHMQTHSSFKNYKCKRCDKSFALKSYLNKHYESACYKDQVPPPIHDSPVPSCSSPPRLPFSPHPGLPHVIHIPTPIFPYK